MLDMMMSLEYQECMVHRTAGRAGQLHIEMAAQPGFAR
jgi:hypothetical protein